MARVLGGRDIPVRDRFIEARPSGARVVLGRRAEKLLAAGCAPVDPGVFGVDVLAGEGPLSPLLSCHPVLLGRQLLFPFFFCLLYFSHNKIVGPLAGGVKGGCKKP